MEFDANLYANIELGAQTNGHIRIPDRLTQMYDKSKELARSGVSVGLVGVTLLGSTLGAISCAPETSPTTDPGYIPPDAILMGCEEAGPQEGYRSPAEVAVTTGVQYPDDNTYILVTQDKYNVRSDEVKNANPEIYRPYKGPIYDFKGNFIYNTGGYVDGRPLWPTPEVSEVCVFQLSDEE